MNRVNSPEMSALAAKYMEKILKPYIQKGYSLDEIITRLDTDDPLELDLIRQVYSKLTADVARESPVSKLRDYQIETVSQCKEALAVHNRCYIQLPTGAGKTRIMYRLIDDDYSTIKQQRLDCRPVYLCLSPRIDLAKQHFSTAKLKDLQTPARIITFSSKDSIAKIDAVFAEWQTNQSDGLIISGMYQSIGRILAWLDSRKLKTVRYIFYDEAHLISRWGSQKVLVNSSDIQTAMQSTGLTPQRVYLSATPTERQYANHDGLWGPLIKPVTVGQLISRGILSPIETLIPNIKITDPGEIKSMPELSTTDSDNDIPGVDNQGLCEILYKTLVYTNSKKAVIFCNTQRKCIELNRLFEGLAKLADSKVKSFVYVGTSVGSEILDDNSSECSEPDIMEMDESPPERGEIERFEKCASPAVVFVCKKISMGYDYPPVDFVGFADPKCSPAELAQCIGRGLRTSPETGKSVCRVFIPITPLDYSSDTSVKRRHQTLFNYLQYLQDELGCEYRIKDRKDIKRTTELNGGVGGGVSSARDPMVESSITLNVFGDIPGYDFLDENKVCLVLAKESVLNNQKTDFSWDNYNRIQHEYYKFRNREYGFKTVKEYFNCDTVKFTDWLDPAAGDLTTMFGKYWKGWYDFLGIDITRFPTSMDAWIAKCRELGIGSHSEYYDSLADNPDLPDEPGYIYPNFTNINACLGSASYRRR